MNAKEKNGIKPQNMCGLCIKIIKIVKLQVLFYFSRVVNVSLTFQPHYLIFFNFFLKGLKSAVVRYRSDLKRTGGREPPKIPEYFETVMDIIGDQKALLNGIEGNIC